MPIDHRGGRQSALYQLISALRRVAPEVVFVRSDPADRYVERIAEETNSLYVDTTANYREWMTVVRDAEFVVTGRYHNPILAAIMGCPSITLASSSHKVHGGCEMIELIGSPYDGTDLLSETPSIVDHARRYVEQRADIRDRLIAVCERRRSETGQLASLVSDCSSRRGYATTSGPPSP
jgi:polysaccharide pyruvyl transferase WcaK-like protein